MGVPSFWQPYVLPTICFHSTALWRQTHFIFSVLHFLMLHIIGFTSYIQATICEKSSKGNRRVKEADFHTGSDKIIFTTYFQCKHIIYTEVCLIPAYLCFVPVLSFYTPEGASFIYFKDTSFQQVPGV